MSRSGRQRLSCSDFRRERKDLLLCVERAHRADIQTYSSGHLGPSSLFLKPLPSRSDKPIWEGSKQPRKASQPSRLEERCMMEVHVEEMKDALYSFTLATTTSTQEPQTQRGTAGPGHLRAAGLEWQQRITDPPTTGSFLPKPGPPAAEASHASTRREELRQRWLFDRKVLRTRDLAAMKGAGGKEVAQRHERKLEQELSRLATRGGPASERLVAFSRVFDDVCDAAPAFGGALREVKREYDLYLNSILSNQSPLLDMSAFIPLKAFLETAKVDEVAQQVQTLEENARKALQENDRVRTEYEEAQAKALENQEEREEETLHPGQSSIPTNEDGGYSDHKQEEVAVASVPQLESKRQQVWRVWKEVQELQKEITETMVSTATTGTLEECIRDTKAEIMRLGASNERLRSGSEDLERNILKVLNRAQVSEEMKAQVLQKIWSILNRD